jgi:hypothetical protein
MGYETPKNHQFWWQTEFHPVFPFFLSASTAATYIFTAPTCTTTIIGLEPCALMNAEYQHFILRMSLLKCLYFADTTERWDRGGERRPKDRAKRGLL